MNNEENLAKSINLCYTYDEFSRVTNTERSEYGNCISGDSFTYDDAGNILSSFDQNGNSTWASYDSNNRITYFNDVYVWYDDDGNMSFMPLCNEHLYLEYDSKNRLTDTGSIFYSYDAEDNRIRKVRYGVETTYTHNTNCKFSQLLVETRNGVETKYVYGLGFIGGETNGEFKFHHFDYRGSTVAITDESGSVISEFEYDTYGRIISGYLSASQYTFLYNGRDGVITDEDQLLYMRARYYSPEIRRFINADIIPGEISNAITLNRFAYANGNPVSNVDPFGLFSLKNLVKSVVGVTATAPVVVVVASAACVGAVVSGTIGAISGYIENGWDGASTGFMVGSISGAATGALVASPASAATVSTGSVATKEILLNAI